MRKVSFKGWESKKPLSKAKDHSPAVRSLVRIHLVPCKYRVFLKKVLHKRDEKNARKNEDDLAER